MLFTLSPVDPRPPNIAHRRGDGRSLHIARTRIPRISGPNSKKPTFSRNTAHAPQGPILLFWNLPVYAPAVAERRKSPSVRHTDWRYPAIITIAPDLYGFPDRREAADNYRRWPPGSCAAMEYTVCRSSSASHAADSRRHSHYDRHTRHLIPDLSASSRMRICFPARSGGVIPSTAIRAIGA